MKTELPKDILAYVQQVEQRVARATPGPIEVHRIDQGDGTIAYQLQQAGDAPRAKSDRDVVGRRVLTEYDDADNPDARADAQLSADARTDLPKLCAIVRALLDGPNAPEDVPEVKP